MGKLDNDKKELMNELKKMGISDSKVIDAFKKVPRENFVLKELRSLSYRNIALPITDNQTISQPFTVAFMLQLLDIKEGDKVLEIGSGSGYNAAIMHYLVGSNGRVYSIEIVRKLCSFARENLKKSRILEVLVIHGDGYKGYKKESPFDKIIITASVPEIPQDLIDQLNPLGGTLLAPVEKSKTTHVMTKFVKNKEKIVKTMHGEFIFVPMTGEITFKRENN